MRKALITAAIIIALYCGVSYLVVLAQAPSTCTVSGTLYNPDATPAAGAQVRVSKVTKNGVLITTGPFVYTANGSGFITFNVIRGTTAYLYASQAATAGQTIGAGLAPFNVSGGVPVSIPNAATQDINTLATVASVPTTGITVTTLASKEGTLTFNASHFTLSEPSPGIANIDVSFTPFVNPMTTRGDIVYRNASNVDARLAVGSANTVLFSNGTDPAYGQVTNAMLAGSIADSKLLTISTAGKVSDSALSSNVPLLNAANNVFTGKHTFGSSPIDLVGLPLSAYRLMGGSDGTIGSPTSSANPSVVFERYDTASATPLLSYVFATNRMTGASSSATYNVWVRAVDNDTGGTFHEVGGLYISSGSDLTNNTGLTKALIIDGNITSTVSPLGLAAEMDITNRTGATAPILTSSIIPLGSSFGLVISPVASGAGSSGVTAGIVFQSATSMQTGIYVAATSIFANRPFIDTEFMSQGYPFLLPNLNLNATGYIYARNAANNGNKKVIGLTSGNKVSIDGDGGGSSFGGSLDLVTGAVFSINSTTVLSNNTLGSGVTSSSLTSVGTIATGVWQGTKIGLAYGGTNADLSATGGTSRFLKQASSGAAVTVVQPAAADLSDFTDFTPVSYSGANFTANGSMTWTVDSGDQKTFQYQILGHRMTVVVALETTTVGGTPNTWLQIAIPAGKTAAAKVIAPISYFDGTNWTKGQAYVESGFTTIFLYADARANWPLATNTNTVYVMISFPIQ